MCGCLHLDTFFNLSHAIIIDYKEPPCPGEQYFLAGIRQSVLKRILHTDS